MSLDFEDDILSRDESSDSELENDDENTASSPSAKKGKTRYKHVPHCEKPPQVVEKRNARERRRVQTVNSAFVKLRRYIPYENKHKRLSKVKTLRKAIEYIDHLQAMLTDYDSVHGSPSPAPMPASSSQVNHEHLFPAAQSNDINNQMLTPSLHQPSLPEAGAMMFNQHQSIEATLPDSCFKVYNPFTQMLTTEYDHLSHSALTTVNNNNNNHPSMAPLSLPSPLFTVNMLSSADSAPSEVSYLPTLLQTLPPSS